MDERTCKVAGCDTPVPAPGGARGMCGKHYLRWKNHGDPLVVFQHGSQGKSNEDRFWPKVNKNGPVPTYAPHLGPCWLWTGGHAKHGYGTFWVTTTPQRGGHLVPAHRFSYELPGRPIPARYDVDHLCRIPACVNPSHLEAVPHRINLLRGVGPSAIHAAKTECPRKHEYDYVDSDGSRGCRRCDRELASARAVTESGPTIACGCGCGETFLQFRAGRPRKFVRGHQGRRAA